MRWDSGLVSAVQLYILYPHCTTKTSITWAWCDWDILVGEDVVSEASSSDNAGGSELRWMFFRLGQMSLLHNWRVITTTRANSVYFSSSAALCRSLGRVSKLPFFSLWLSRKEREERKCPSPTFAREIHHPVFRMRTNRFQEWKTDVSQNLHGLIQILKPIARSLRHTLTLFDIPLRRLCIGCSSASYSKYLFIYAWTLYIYSPCNLFICTFSFLSIWCTVLERGTCMLQQDVGFVLTRLISCRRRHRLIKIIPCYRGCFGQPNDTGGLLCSTGCSRSANGAPQLQLAPN